MSHNDKILHLIINIPMEYNIIEPERTGLSTLLDTMKDICQIWAALGRLESKLWPDGLDNFQLASAEE